MTWQVRHPLAFNIDHDPIQLPPAAAAWRVRYVPRGSLQLKRGESPEPVKGLDGSLLYLRLTDSPAELRKNVALSGLYRLDAVSTDLRVLADVEPAYVELVPQGLTNGWVAAAYFVGEVSKCRNPAPRLPRKQEAAPPSSISVPKFESQNHA